MVKAFETAKLDFKVNHFREAAKYTENLW